MIQNEAAHQLETAQENVYNVMLNEKKKKQIYSMFLTTNKNICLEKKTRRK